MAQQLNIRQRNNLLTGNRLAAEVPASAPNLRAFIEIWAHAADREWGGVSKFLNADTSNLRFDLWKYEIDRSYYDTDGWDWDRFVRGDIHKVKDIPTIEDLERILAEYLDDVSILDWRLVTPM